MGALCLTGEMRRTHEGATGFALVAEERLVRVGEDTVRDSFVAVSKNRLWLLKVVGGIGAVKGALRRTAISEALYTHLR